MKITAWFIWLAFLIVPYTGLAADRLLGIHSARVMSQSLPWIAEEAGLFRKYNLEFPLVYIGSSPLATAAMLGGDGELLMDGGLGTVHAYVQGNTELVCIGGQKNILTQSILAKPVIKKLEDLRGKKVGVTRIGSTTHYFATEAFRKIGMEAGRDYTVIQTGGAPEMLAALRRTGWGNYSLFMRPDGTLFGYVETPEGLDAARDAMSKEEVNTRWQAFMSPYFEAPEGAAPDQMMQELEEVFHLD